MVTARESQPFPTRHYPYGRAMSTAHGESNRSGLAPDVLHAFVLGLDAGPRPLSDDDARRDLNDPFATLLRSGDPFPLTLRSLLAAFDARAGAGVGGALTQQDVFLAADGGQIPWSPETADIRRDLRFAIVLSTGNGRADVMVSASTALDSESQFLQVLAWDETVSLFNFYERRSGTWLWSGHSDHALDAATRGRGPFDSHVSGGPVMKELRLPWSNWHSMSASIPEAVLAPGDPLREEPLFRARASADTLERSVVRPGVERLNKARLARSMSHGEEVRDLPSLMRHVLDTPTVNLASSDQVSASVSAEDELTLPPTFFLNADALLDEIGLNPAISAVKVRGALYLASLQRYEFALTDGTFRQPGDTHFAFLVPEPAFEDTNVLSLLLRRGILDRHLATCLLMVDFPNPILSERRRALLRYVPATCCLVRSAGASGTSTDLRERLARAVAASPASADPASAERELLASLDRPEVDFRRECEDRLEAYFSALASAAQTDEGFDGWVRLAESRRRDFKRRPLAEFRLTIPATNIANDAPRLEMTERGAAQAAGSHAPSARPGS